MSTGVRRGLFAIIVAVCSLAAAASVLSATRDADPAAHASAEAREVLPSARADRRPMLITRRMQPDGLQGPGEVSAAPLSEPGSRTVTPLRCDRVHFAGGRGLCLVPGRGFAAGYVAKVFGADFRIEHEVEVAGAPSRARVSPDGRYGSVTLFVSGHSYATPGSFSTQTTLIDMERGEKIAELEEFTVTKGGRQVTAVDVNFWGVTFAQDSDRFYATMATGGETYLIEGSIGERTAHTLHENVECPSLSPDGTRVAYKKLGGSGKRPWRLTVLDLATMRETPLAEGRSVDDQAEWLDDDHVLYGVDAGVYAARADGGGRPRQLAAEAGSPAVVRW